ncbi:ubiquinol-cytochrome-c reductase complex assembly factor 1 [Periplaneta americana]|uniref:ubiquinol-cytochrome-c reductase complex assembly factor 1 n=1 Tax=Periplaneta americana TaxID=6978 RepID=UPI0037E76A3B
MYYQSIFRTFKVSRCAQPLVLKSWAQSFIAQDRVRCIPCFHTCISKQRNAVISHDKPQVGFVKKFLKRVGWLDHSKSRLKISGYLLYESVADKIPYMQFFREFHMADTFYSWFLITELHVWMLMVRTMAEGEEGRFTRNSIVEAMWQDTRERSKKLDASNPSGLQRQLYELSQQFQAAMIGYDEGLLSDDKVLAGAVWRRFFQRDCNDPEHIECLVHYIRKQVKHLDGLDREDILIRRKITWLELPQKFDT